MIIRLLNITLISILFSSTIFSQGIVVDHNSLDISEIPANIIDSIKQNKKLQWAGTSHAHQITAGLKHLETEFSNFDVTIGDGTNGESSSGGFLPDPNNTFCIMDGVVLHFSQCGMCCLGIGPDAYWQGQDAWNSMEKTFNCYPDINVSGWLWCGECAVSSESEIQSYLDTMSTYESIYPNVQFIYTTEHAQFDGALGYNRHLRNNQIRQFCADNNKILFDFSDIDCWYNGEFSYYLHNGDTVPIQHPQYSGDYYHTTELNCKNKARAMWYLMARMSGWSPGITLDLQVYLEGPFNGLEMNNSLNNSGTIPMSQPYNIAPWNYNGTENVTSIPNEEIVDWVLIELRDATHIFNANEETIIGTRTGFLKNNGSIVDMDGFSPLSFEDISVNNNLYVVIRHLNHLDIISLNPVNIVGNNYEYDYSSSEFQVFGGVYGHKELAPGIWGMISGDGNADGIININDKNVTWLNQSGHSGYKSADYNLGGKVDNQDKNEKWLENIGKETQIPD